MADKKLSSYQRKKQEIEDLKEELRTHKLNLLKVIDDKSEDFNDIQIIKVRAWMERDIYNTMWAGSLSNINVDFYNPIING